MTTYVTAITIIGLALLTIAWLPSIIKKVSISYSVVYLAIGFVVYLLIDKLPWPNPVWYEGYTVHLTELAVIIALMGTGLAIDKPFSFRGWKVPLRLVSVTMLLSIGSLALIAMLFLGFDLASAVLLGAVLAPTDPVLASEVQVNPPNEGDEDEAHFALTAEAGMNDGMAFPFTWLAIALTATSYIGDGVMLEWLWQDLFYRIIAGIIIGYGIGQLVYYFYFRLPELKKMPGVQDGFVAIAATLFVYGITEMMHGYGFIAVFITAITIRNNELTHEYHKDLHSFTNQVERILLVVLLLLFGGSLAHGLLDKLTVPMALVGLAFLLLIRPITAWLGLLNIGMHHRRKLFISFFGIRGIGSFFYLSFALQKADFLYRDELWSLTAFIVLVSIVLHGVTAAKGVDLLVDRK